jgi:hypothetical protein
MASIYPIARSGKLTVISVPPDRDAGRRHAAERHIMVEAQLRRSERSRPGTARRRRNL